MPVFGPIKRIDLIRCLEQLGFEGPYSGEKRPVHDQGESTLRVPNPHQGDIGKELLSRILR